MYLKSYYKSCKRGEFEWEPILINNNIVELERLIYEYRIAEVILSSTGYIVNITGLKHSPFSTSTTRKSRKTARKLAEKLILKDIEKSNTLAVCDMELLAK